MLESEHDGKELAGRFPVIPERVMSEVEDVAVEVLCFDYVSGSEFEVVDTREVGALGGHVCRLIG